MSASIENPSLKCI